MNPILTLLKLGNTVAHWYSKGLSDIVVSKYGVNDKIDILKMIAKMKPTLSMYFKISIQNV